MNLKERIEELSRVLLMHKEPWYNSIRSELLAKSLGEALEIIKKQQEIIDACKMVFGIIAESYSPGVQKAANNILNTIKEMEENDTDSN